MSTQAIRLDKVYVQDNGDGYLDPAKDALTDEHGVMLDPSSPEWIALTDKLKTQDLKGLWLSDVDFYLRRFEAAEKHAETGELEEVKTHLQYAASYSRGTHGKRQFSFNQERAKELHEIALINSLENSLMEFGAHFLPFNLGIISFAAQRLHSAMDWMESRKSAAVTPTN